MDNEDLELLSEVNTHLAQAADLLDVLILYSTSGDAQQLIGPLEILKRDLLNVQKEVNDELYKDE